MIRKLILPVLLTALIAGCGGTNHAPVTAPDSDPGQHLSDNIAQAASAGGGRVLWGLWELLIIPSEGTVEIVPLRTAGLHLNVAKILDTPPVNFTFTNFSLDKSTNTIGLDVGLTHPYAGKLNFAGFNVHGILIGPGSVPGYDDPSIILAGPNDTHLLNPDGLTRWWNPVEFPQANSAVDDAFKYNDGKFGVPDATGGVIYDATLNAYKLFSDDLDAAENILDLDLLERGVFRPGVTNVRHYDIWLPLDAEDKWDFHYNYAIDASWAAIPGYVPGQEVNIPGDYPPNANEHEAFRVDVVNIDSTLFYEDDIEKGGSATLTVRIFDWQGLLDAGDVADQITSVKLECPTCFEGVVTGTVTDAGADPLAYAEYELTIDGQNLKSSGEGHTALLTVVSAYGDYQPLLTQFAGTSDLAYYDLVTFPSISPQAPPNLPPVAAATSDTDNIGAGDPIGFDGSGSYDSDGTVVKYEWDFNNDGNFGDSYDLGTDEKPYVIFTIPGEYEVNLKVTDNDDAVDTLDDLLAITVTPPNDPPVAAAGTAETEVPINTTVIFDGTGSFDPDGTIVAYSWDFDGDDIFDIPTGGTNEMPEWIFNDVGVYAVDLTVEDNLGATDDLDTKLFINVYEVDDNLPPLACAGIDSETQWVDDPVIFDATCSTDSDGTIIAFLWDFNNDGFYGDPYENGTDDMPELLFPTGNHTVDLKVVDNGGLSDVLDEKITFFVESHVVITLEEDQAYKATNGYEYYLLTGNAQSEPVPIDYLSRHGPWDFTSVTFGPSTDNYETVPTNDPIVAPYIPDYFPVETQYFASYGLHAFDVNGLIYFAEEVDNLNEQLLIHGYLAYDSVTDSYEAYSFTPEAEGPVTLQYPWDWTMDELSSVVFKIDNVPWMTITYHEYATGEGYVTVPYNSGYTEKSLLTVSTVVINLGGTDIISLALFKWTGDGGIQLARLNVGNTTEIINYDPDTLEITGDWVLNVLKDDL